MPRIIMIFMSPFLWILFASYCHAEKGVQTGTTLVCIKFDRGVVVGADTRTSVSSYVSHRFAHKLQQIGDHSVILRSGSAADTQTLASLVSLELEERRILYGLHSTATEVAKVIQSSIYNGNYQASILIAGMEGSVPRIYNVAVSGAFWEEPLFAASGSGSSYLTGFLDDTFRHTSSLDLDEAKALSLCHKAVGLAIDRDGSSGGFVRLAIIDEDGVRHYCVRHNQNPLDAIN